MPDDDSSSGPIEGLLLPRRAWLVLQRERITTLGRLAAVADRIEKVIPGIGPKTARLIREELARVTTLGKRC